MSDFIQDPIKNNSWNPAKGDYFNEKIHEEDRHYEKSQKKKKIIISLLVLIHIILIIIIFTLY